MQIKAGEGESTAQNFGLRGLFMIVFIMIFYVAQTFLNLLAVIQFIWLLFTREPNHILVQFGSSLSIWFNEVTRFLSCASEDKPFPWGPWPDADVIESKSLPRQPQSPTP